MNIRRVIEAIPYKTKEENRKILDRYRANSIVQTYNDFVYIERIEDGNKESYQ